MECETLLMQEYCTRAEINFDVNDHHERFQMLADLDLGQNAIAICSSTLSSASLAPSLLVNTFSGDRRLLRRESSSSLGSSTHMERLCDTPPDAVSPVTPLNDGHFGTISSLPTMYDSSQEAHDDEVFLRMSETAQDQNMQSSTMTPWHDRANNYAQILSLGFQQDAANLFEHRHHSVLSNKFVNPVLSPAIFDDSQPLAMLQPTQHVVSWSSSDTNSQPETVVPIETIHSYSSSYTDTKPGPETPLPRNEQLSMAILSSSPMPLYSPGVLPSQRENEELPRFFSDDVSASVMTPVRTFDARGGHLSKRSWVRKSAGTNPKPKSGARKSGIDCEEVIPSNSFACKYECLDKKSNKVKKFRRQEHKKRHERTVHEKHLHGLHECWVPGCTTTPFTRTDNLRTHLRDTHGRKSAGSRNRYVATLDVNSPWYDPGFVGELTEAGLPIR